jgi:hypothetical protein
MAVNSRLRAVRKLKTKNLQLTTDFLILLLVSSIAYGQSDLQPIGTWKEYLPYQNALDVTASETKIIAATPYSLFTIDKATKEINRLSKVTVLSETGISRIKYDPLSKKLYIAYSNSNIDVIANGQIHNIAGIKRSNIPGVKTVYDIYPDGDLCYLATGLGVIVLDALKYEVKETWFIGSNGASVKTYGFLETTTGFYAATEEGLKTLPLTGTNPIDFRNWQLASGSNGLPAGEAKAVVSFQNKEIVQVHDSLFIQNGNAWSLYYSNGWTITSISASADKFFVSQRKTTGEAQVVVLFSNGTIERTIQQPGFISYPKTVINVNGEYWIADLYGGLTHWTGTAFESYRLNSPQDLSSGDMAAGNNVLYVTAGSVNSSWNYQYDPSGIFKYKDGTWTNYNMYTNPKLDSLLDFITVSIDPRDQSAWAGSFGGGLVHILTDNNITIYKQNSPLLPPVGDPGSYRVSGLAFDEENNLWISNFGSAKQLHVLKSNGNWQSFTAPLFINENAVTQIVVDDIGQKWIASPLGNGLIVFDEGNIDNTADDKWKLYKAGTGTGNLPSNEVLSIAKDKSGFIWVGTNNGIAVIQCPENAFTSSACDALWPVIKEDNFANYLFKGQEVRSIAVDGADRKWIATASGAWLISPGGDKIIAHYTEENSGLLANDVKKIIINGATGEVFIATAKGLNSFRGTATEVKESNNTVTVFPNPVPPGYTGQIGIRGLPENSTVKITELNGRLVHETKALGGQAVWNGYNYKGSRAATGVYLVIAVNQQKQETIVGKIVFISQ